jgi:hypothetical protein
MWQRGYGHAAASFRACIQAPAKRTFSPRPRRAVGRAAASAAGNGQRLGCCLFRLPRGVEVDKTAKTDWRWKRKSIYGIALACGLQVGTPVQQNFKKS